METDTALQAARDNNQSILVTLRANGRPQLSNVLHTVGADGVIRVSTTTDRAKYANLRRTPVGRAARQRTDVLGLRRPRG